MACSCQRGRRPDLRNPPPEALRLTGTFDFRWPRNTKIRIAFQGGVAPAVMGVGIKLVEDALKHWGLGTTIAPGGPALAYQILPELVFPAADDPDGLKKVQADQQRRTAVLAKDLAAPKVGADQPHPDAAKQLEQKQRLLRDLKATDNFLAKSRPQLAKPSDGRLAGAIETHVLDYDVLISFAPMPLVIPGTDHLENAARVIVYAQSELGAYARREDFGLPTAYLGRPTSFKKEGDDDADVAWLNSSEGNFTLHHEIGHILGLAHEHQNPRRTALAPLTWRRKAEILEILKSRGLEPLYQDFIDLDLVEPFPLLPGAECFSQWRTPSDAEVAGGLIDSVMIEPIYRCMLQSREPGHDCLNDPKCSVEQAIYQKLLKPTSSDLDTLLQIYPPAPQQQQAL